MAGQGASLQNYNNELVKCIEDLREKREEINRQILKEEEEKVSLVCCICLYFCFLYEFVDSFVPNFSESRYCHFGSKE